MNNYILSSVSLSTEYLVTSDVNELIDIKISAEELSNYATKSELSTTAQGLSTYIDTTVTAKIAEVVDSAPEAFDTLKEIAEWILSDQTASEQLIERVDTISTDLDTLETKVEGLSDIYDSKGLALSAKQDVEAEVTNAFNTLSVLETLPTDGSATPSAILTKVNTVIEALKALSL